MSPSRVDDLSRAVLRRVAAPAFAIAVRSDGGRDPGRIARPQSPPGLRDPVRRRPLRMAEHRRHVADDESPAVHRPVRRDRVPGWPVEHRRRGADADGRSRRRDRGGLPAWSSNDHPPADLRARRVPGRDDLGQRAGSAEGVPGGQRARDLPDAQPHRVVADGICLDASVEGARSDQQIAGRRGDGRPTELHDILPAERRLHHRPLGLHRDGGLQRDHDPRIRLEADRAQPPVRVLRRHQRLSQRALGDARQRGRRGARGGRAGLGRSTGPSTTTSHLATASTASRSRCWRRTIRWA